MIDQHCYFRQSIKAEFGFAVARNLVENNPASIMHV